MKNFNPVFALCVALALTLTLSLIVSCAGGAEPADGGTTTLGGGVIADAIVAARQGISGGEVKSLNDVEGKEWSLTELRTAGNTVRIDRSKLDAANINSSFTISFQEGRVSGIGWPNRYFGPYTVGSGDALTISDALASTMMAAFIELDELKEHEYYAYLAKVTRWAVQDGKLELYSTTDGRETVLVFELR